MLCLFFIIKGFEVNMIKGLFLLIVGGGYNGVLLVLFFCSFNFLFKFKRKRREGGL